MRVRGTITAFDGNVLSVKSRDGKDLKLKLADNATVVAAKAMKLEDLKPGDYVGSTTRAKDGVPVALEVHTLAPTTPQGHVPWDLEPDTMMTNGNVAAVVQSAGGQQLTLEYKGGAQKIVVPAGTPIVTNTPADRSFSEARRIRLYDRSGGRRRHDDGAARTGQPGRRASAAVESLAGCQAHPLPLHQDPKDPMKIALTSLLIALALPAYSAETQTPVRVRGTIAAFDGNALSVKAQDGKNVDVQLGEKTVIVYMQPIALADIKPGDFLGVTSMKRSDGTLSRRGRAPHAQARQPGAPAFRRPRRPDDDQCHGCHDGAVDQRTGADFELRRRLAEDRRAGRRGDLDARSGGALAAPARRAVNLTAMPGADGKLTAQNIQVGKPGVKPPQ